MIKPIQIEEIPKIESRKLKIEIEEFLASGAQAGEIQLDGRLPGNVAANLRTYIRRFGYPLRQVQRKNRVYVIRTDDV